KGDGTFGDAVLTAVPDGGDHLAAADFNGDGKPELLTGPDLLQSNGNGTFRVIFAFVASSGHPFLTGDFNGDGKTDVISAGFGTVYLYAGKGDGTFQNNVPLATYPTLGFNIDYDAIDLARTDLNGDGRPDLVVTTSGFTTNQGNFSITLQK